MRYGRRCQQRPRIALCGIGDRGLPDLVSTLSLAIDCQFQPFGDLRFLLWRHIAYLITMLAPWQAKLPFKLECRDSQLFGKIAEAALAPKNSESREALS